MFSIRIKIIVFICFIVSCKKETYVHSDLNCSCAEAAEGTYVGNYHANTTSLYPTTSYDTTYVKTYSIVNKSIPTKCQVMIDTSNTFYEIKPDGKVSYWNEPIIKDGFMDINHQEYYGGVSGGFLTGTYQYHGIKQ